MIKISKVLNKYNILIKYFKGKVKNLEKKLEEEKSNAIEREKILHEKMKRLMNQLEAEKSNSDLWEKKFQKAQSEFEGNHLIYFILPNHLLFVSYIFFFF